VGRHASYVMCLRQRLCIGASFIRRSSAANPRCNVLGVNRPSPIKGPPTLRGPTVTSWLRQRLRCQRRAPPRPSPATPGHRPRDPCQFHRKRRLVRRDVASWPLRPTRRTPVCLPQNTSRPVSRSSNEAAVHCGVTISPQRLRRFGTALVRISNGLAGRPRLQGLLPPPPATGARRASRAA
jgi:hypothetical protein